MLKILFFIVFFAIAISIKAEEIQNSNKINAVNNESFEDIVKYTNKLYEDALNLNITNGEIKICTQCEFLIRDLIKLRKSGASRESVRKFVAILCGLVLNYVPSACQVFSEIETDVILYIIDNKDIKPEEICGVYFQYKGCLNPYAKKWHIDIPPIKKKSNQMVKKSNEKPLKIVQITDVHYDPLYKAGSNAKCELPLCCEERNGIPVDSKDGAGNFGDYRVCDMSKNSIVNLMSQIQQHKNIDYLYFTGDIIAHKNWETSRKTNLDTIEEFYGFIYNYFPNVSVYPILGNHEAHPCNLYAPLNLTSADAVTTQWLFDAVAKFWTKWLPPNALKTIKYGGYYTVLAKPGFRIIALNSNVCFTENYWLFYDDEDPYDQLKWLVQVLLEAEKNNEKVHILSHVPAGEAMCHRQWQYNFNKIVQRFSKIISAHFNGHTHVDEFRIFKNENDKNEVINVAFNGGSFTTFVGLNPDYRLYDVDPEDFMVLDYDQYTFNLTLANAHKGAEPDWFKLYSFKSAYGLTTLDYASLNKLNERLITDSKLAEQYFRFHVRGSEYAFENGCNKTCIQSQICHISATDADESIRCGAYTIFD